MSERRVEFHYKDKLSQRLDKYLVQCLPEFSRARLQAFIKDGRVDIDGVPARKAGQMLEGSAMVRVIIPENQPVDLIPEKIPLDIIFENNDLIVVNKPAGMVVHPAAGHQSGTLVHAALAHAPEMDGVGGVHRPGVVHRLDKDTSGLILLAKNDSTHRKLQDQFRARKVDKHYITLVDGHPATPVGRIEAPIGRDTRQRKQMAVVSERKGRSAISDYSTIEVFQEHTLLDVHPITGRTHQIRLHMAFIGCPVTGDVIYGKRHPTISLGRHFLHAARLTIQLPGERTPRIFSAPLPPELDYALENLRQYNRLLT